MITSKENIKIKQLKRLKHKKYRRIEKKFIVEGKKIVDILKNKKLSFEILTSCKNEEGTKVSDEIIKQLSSTKNPENIIAICDFLKFNESELSNKILAVDDISDPGNLGTLIRCAEAFGFNTVLVSEGSVDIYNDKLLRSAKGSIFNVNIKQCSLYTELIKYNKLNYSIVTTKFGENNDNQIFIDNNKNNINKFILVLGNESHGVSDDIYKISNYNILIDTVSVNSLNVSIAGAILMHKFKEL